jgi:hypothetical protein
MKKTELFETIKKSLVLYGVVGVLVLATVAVTAATHGTVNTFMWVRAALLIAVTPILLRFARDAYQGSRRSLDRLRTVCTILPIAIIVVDLIPGVCPAWYAAMQGLSALALVGVAVLARRPVAVS